MISDKTRTLSTFLESRQLTIIGVWPQSVDKGNIHVHVWVVCLHCSYVVCHSLLSGIAVAPFSGVCSTLYIIQYSGNGFLTQFSWVYMSNIVTGNCCGQQCCQRLDLLSIHKQLLPATHNCAATYHTQGNYVVGNSCQQQSCFMYGPLKAIEYM